MTRTSMQGCKVHVCSHYVHTAIYIALPLPCVVNRAGGGVSLKDWSRAEVMKPDKVNVVEKVHFFGQMNKKLFWCNF
jgi:hypothetical protein